MLASGPARDATVAGTAAATQAAVRGERTVVAPPLGIERPELRAVFELINVERSRTGLAPLSHDVLLSQAAQFHSDDMARRETLTHWGPNGESSGDRIAATGYKASVWAANVAAGYRVAGDLVDAWMDSTSHRENLLHGAVTEVGLGVGESSSGRTYWAVELAEPAD